MSDEKIDEFEPAFPFVCNDLSKNQCAYSGMSLRQYFAGLAMQGLLTRLNSLYFSTDGYPPQAIIKVAIDHADFLISALKEPPK